MQTVKTKLLFTIASTTYSVFYTESLAQTMLLVARERHYSCLSQGQHRSAMPFDYSEG